MLLLILFVVFVLGFNKDYCSKYTIDDEECHKFPCRFVMTHGGGGVGISVALGGHCAPFYSRE